MRLKVKTVGKWVLVTLLILVLGIGAALFIFKDRIVQQVIVEVNKSLKVPLEVSKVDLDFFYGFPNVAIAFNDVVLPADREIPFLAAKRLYAVINPIQIIRGKLIIERIEVLEAKVNIIIDEENKNNVSDIFAVEGSEDSLGTDDSQFKLNSVILINSEFIHHNYMSGSESHWLFKRIEGSISFIDEIYSGRILGSLSLLKMSTRNWQSGRKRDFNLDLNIKYSITSKEAIIENSTIDHEGASFLMDGAISFSETPDLNLAIDGEQVTFALITSFLPTKLANTLKKFESSGSINFNTKIVGRVTETRLPSLDAVLHFNDVNLTDEVFKANINDLSLKSDLHFDDIGNVASGSLKVTEAHGLLAGNPFEMSLAIENFISPKYDGSFNGKVATSWLLANLKLPLHNSGKGNIDVKLSASGAYRKEGSLNQPDLSGSFKLNDISFQWADTISINRIDGLVRFEGDKINLTNLKLSWLQSDVTINGSMLDIQPTRDNPKGNFLLKSDVRSRRLAVEDIVALIRNVPTPVVADSTNAPNPQLDLELIWAIEHLSFKKYHGEDISGEVTLQDDLLEVVDLTGNGLGGKMKINGKLKFMPNDDVYISTNVLTRGVYLDSLFYVFNNFGQKFITYENLKGLLYADVFASMYFDGNWRFRRPLFTSIAEIRIVEGELNDFAPIMALSDFINDEDDNLSNLKFSHIVNHITIREDTLHIPEMSIQTNVRNIALGGYHTLDQHINYQLAVPIINERVDKDEAFGAVQKSSKGSPNLLFRIKGTTTNYRVNYDLLRATGNVLKLLDITKIFKKKGKIPVDSTFLDDEEFDWEN